MKGLTKRYDGVLAADNVSFDVRRGEFFSLLGPSGCGKTTTLRCVAGFEVPSAGQILIGERLVNALPPYERPCGFVFQSYALFPHLTVRDNVAYGLNTRRFRREGLVSKLSVLARMTSSRIARLPADIVERVDRALGLVELGGLGPRYPSQLSAGQQQRVALARALVVEPEVLLMDEPLSNLDLRLRVEMRDVIRQIQNALSITMIYVTHDQEEALGMADRIAVMRDGRIEQLGTPIEVYSQPQSPFVAEFLGGANRFPGRIVRRALPYTSVVTADGIEIAATAAPDGRENISIIVRPESIIITTAYGAAGPNVLRGRVTKRTFLGPIVRYEVAAGPLSLKVDSASDGSIVSVGSEVTVTVPPERVLLL
ncbi:MAG: ABC transporter ATP-binding protein [Chloroflexi bacterium]|nr:ABC transporter ATP-binding protein [Chloroflexota bacterium]